MSKKTTIILGVTGSIAAYKSAEIVRLMVKEDWDLHVIMTRHATHFVGELTFRTISRNPVGLDMFAERPAWCPEHIELADTASAFVIAPATGNLLAKYAHGIADDLLTSTLLATEAPVAIAPAMNGKMWDHAATQENVRILKDRGVSFIHPDEGDLACGYEGVGKMASPEMVLAAVKRVVAG